MSWNGVRWGSGAGRLVGGVSRALGGGGAGAPEAGEDIGSNIPGVTPWV